MTTMRTIAGLMFAVCVAQGADVVFDLADFAQGNIASKRVTITPQSTPRTNSNLIISSDKIRYTTDADGQFTVTNMVEGNYLCELSGPFSITEFRILVPDTNATIYARDLMVSTNSVPSENAGYSQSQANGRFVLRENGWSTNQILTNAFFKGSTNVFQHTNGAASGYVLKTDGTNAYWSAAGGGESTTGSNLSETNATTIPVFFQLNGTDLEFRTLRAGNNMVLTNEGTNIVFASTASGGGNLETNANQFGENTTLTIKSGVTLTNAQLYGGRTIGNWTNANALYLEGNVIGNNAVVSQIASIRTSIGYMGIGFVTNALQMINATGNRVAVFDSANKLLTNSANVDITELSYLDGVSSAIQTQLDSKTGPLTSLQFTNHGTTTNYIAPWFAGDMGLVFWDDFSRPNTTNTANGGTGLGASSPSGHPYIIDGPSIGTLDTNAFIRSGRAVIETQPTPTSGNPSFYIMTTNIQGVTRMGMRYVHFDEDAAGSHMHGGTMAVKPVWGAETYMVHFLTSTNEMSLQITTNGVGNLFTLATIPWRRAGTNGQSYVYEMEYLGNNTILIDGNGTNQVVRHPQIDVAWRGPNDENSGTLYWQIGSSSTNTRNRLEMDAIWAGHARGYQPEMNANQFGTYWNGPGAARFHSANWSITSGSKQTNNAFFNSSYATPLMITNNGVTDAIALAWDDAANSIYSSGAGDGMDYTADSSHLFWIGGTAYVVIDSAGHLRPFTDITPDLGIITRQWRTNWVKTVEATNVNIRSQLAIPSGTSPTTDAAGEIAFDTDAWTRGAVQAYDGTANTYLVGTLTTDTPSDGQVPKWNTGGTITWEDDATGGSASTNNVNMNAAYLLVTNWVEMPWAEAADGALTWTEGNRQLMNGVVNTNITGPDMSGTTTNREPMILRFVQDGTGNRTLTHNGSAVNVRTGANQWTDVIIYPGPDQSTNVVSDIILTVDGSPVVDPIDLDSGGEISVANASGTITWTIKDDIIAAANFADGDWGDVSVSGNSVTLDDDVVGTAEMADADHGFFSYSTGAASLDANGLTSANLTSAITDETGSGRAVFGQDTDLTGTTEANALNMTNSIGHFVSTLAGLGGANTNFTVDAQGPQRVYIDAGTTNVNLFVMNYSAAVQHSGVLILTNRTGTSRTLSFDTTTNNWISLQQYDGLSGAITVTNGTGVWLSYEILGTNTYYGFKHIPNPTN